jgi:hypothetical protein
MVVAAIWTDLCAEVAIKNMELFDIAGFANPRALS